MFSLINTISPYVPKLLVLSETPSVIFKYYNRTISTCEIDLLLNQISEANSSIGVTRVSNRCSAIMWGGFPTLLRYFNILNIALVACELEYTNISLHTLYLSIVPLDGVKHYSQVLILADYFMYFIIVAECWYLIIWNEHHYLCLSFIHNHMWLLTK